MRISDWSSDVCSSDHDDACLFLKEQRMRHRSVGLVTTMGALHKGHLSLIARSKEENEFTLCSIFVNPTQFNDPADLERYPRPIERAVEALCTAGCDALFLPERSEEHTSELQSLMSNSYAVLSCKKKRNIH